MTWEPRRRRFIQLGAALGMAGTTGCSELESTSSQHESVLPAAYVIYKSEGTVAAVNGQTQTIEFSGTAGEEDGPIIQRALDSVKNGGLVYITNGTYEIQQALHERPHGALDIKHDGTVLAGDGAYLRFHDHDPQPELNDNTFEQTDLKVKANNVAIAGLTLDANKSNRASSMAINLLGLTGRSERLWIRDCIIQNSQASSGFRGYGMGIFECSHVTIQNVLFRNNDRHAIHPGVGNDGDYAATNYQITNCTFIGNGDGVNARDGTTDINISNCYFESNDQALEFVGQNPPNERIRVTDNIFVDNHGRDQTTHQVIISAAFDVIQVTGNVFRLPKLRPANAENVSGRGHLFARVQGDRGTLSVSNNEFRGGRGTAVAVNGDATTLETVLIEGNHFAATGVPQVRLDGGKKGLVRMNTFDRIRDGSQSIAMNGLSRAALVDNVLDGGEIPQTLHDHSGTIVQNNVIW